MHCVLDLDLDFFVSPAAQNREGRGRLPEHSFSVASPDDARRFLERSCHLSTSARIPGRGFSCHKDSFKVWRRWIADGILEAPFEIAHVDAHSDLGCSSWIYLLSDLLAKPADKRAQPKFGKSYLNSANYLLYAIANHWVSRLTYIYPAARGESPSGVPDDLPDYVFHNEDPHSGRIQLRCYSTKDLRSGIMTQPLRVEDPVSFSYMRSAQFTTKGITHIVVAQSRSYTPRSADRLLPVIAEYFNAT